MYVIQGKYLGVTPMFFTATKMNGTTYYDTADSICKNALFEIRGEAEYHAEQLRGYFAHSEQHKDQYTKIKVCKVDILVKGETNET